MTRNLFYATLSAGTAVLMLVLLVAAGRWLGVQDYGDFVWVVNLATIAEVFMDFGLHQITVRAIARDAQRAGQLLHTSMRLKALPGVGMIVVFTLLAVLQRSEPTVRLACTIMLVSATMRSYLLTAKGVLQGLEAFGADALVTAVDRALLLAACSLALWRGASIVQLSLVFLGARVVSAAVALALARRRVGPGRSDPELWRALPIEALPVGLFLLVLNLYNRVDMDMLGAMAGSRATGLYGAAYPLYEGLTYATAVISAVLVPRLSRLWEREPAAYGRLVLQGLAGAVGLAVIVAAVAWPLADWGIRIFGAGFDPAATTLRWLLLGLPFVYVIWVLHSVAIASHHTRTLLVVTAIGTALNVTLNAFLIPRYSYDGAAIATVISEGVAMVMLLVGLRQALRAPALTVA
jgi:O-antigen/teichoic acid export membrane protein